MVYDFCWKINVQYLAALNDGLHLKAASKMA